MDVSLQNLYFVSNQGMLTLADSYVNNEGRLKRLNCCQKVTHIFNALCNREKEYDRILQIQCAIAKAFRESGKKAPLKILKNVRSFLESNNLFSQELSQVYSDRIRPTSKQPKISKRRHATLPVRHTTDEERLLNETPTSFISSSSSIFTPTISPEELQQRAKDVASKIVQAVQKSEYEIVEYMDPAVSDEVLREALTELRKEPKFTTTFIDVQPSKGEKGISRWDDSPACLKIKNPFYLLEDYKQTVSVLQIKAEGIARDVLSKLHNCQTPTLDFHGSYSEGVWKQALMILKKNNIKGEYVVSSEASMKDWTPPYLKITNSAFKPALEAGKLFPTVLQLVEESKEQEVIYPHNNDEVLKLLRPMLQGYGFQVEFIGATANYHERYSGKLKIRKSS